MRAQGAGAGVVRAPVEGLWRVGRAEDPLAPGPPLGQEELEAPGAGGRFDDPRGEYRVLYLARSQEGAFGEVLARFRASPGWARVTSSDWEAQGFRLGVVTRGFRSRRALALGEVSPGARFLDVEDAGTVQRLRRELGWAARLFGVSDVDIAALRGPDRRVTRLVSAWAHAQEDGSGMPFYAGIRYLSRHFGGWECWALFTDVATCREVRREAIEPDNPALVAVCDLYRLRIAE